MGEQLLAPSEFAFLANHILHFTIEDLEVEEAAIQDSNVAVVLVICHSIIGDQERNAYQCLI